MDDIASHSFNRLEALIASTDDWLWEVDINSLYTYSSPQVEGLLGYTPKEIIGLSPFDLMPKTEAVRVRGIFEHYVKEKHSFTLIKNYALHKNGHLVLLESSGKPFFNSDNEFAGYRGIDRDITKREINSLEKKSYEVALNLLEEAVIATDPNGIIVYLNDTFRKMMGYTFQDLRGKNINCLNHLEMDPKFSITTSKIRARINYTTKRQKKNGEVIDVLIHRAPIFDDKANVVRLIGSYLDLSKIIDSKKAINSAEQILTSAFSKNPVPMYIVDIDTEKKLAINIAFQEIFKDNSNKPTLDSPSSNSALLNIKEEQRILNKLTKTGRIYREPITLKHSNGSYINFLASGQVFNLKEKNICTFVLEDVTKENTLNSELSNINHLLNITNEVAKIGGWELDLETNKISWTTETKKIHQVSMDYEPAFNTAINFYHPDDREKIRSSVNELIKTGVRYNLELRIVTKAGNEINIRTIGERIEENGKVLKIFGSFQDITEYKKLKNSQQELGKIIHESLNEVYIFNAQTLEFISLNKGAQKNLQYTQDEVSKLNLLDIIPEHSEKSFNEMASPLLTMEKDILVYESYHQRKDSSRYPVEIHLQLIIHGGVKVFLSNVTDITQIQKSNRYIKKINRSLKTLLHINQSIIHSSSEEELLNSVCQTLVKSGDYLLSWIGFTVHDKSKSIQAVAQYGYDEEYIKSLNLVWSNTKKGLGPTGTAIRNGKYVLAKDIYNDPQFEPWRKNAEKNGYQSALSLPLIIEDETIGAISIYAAESNAFDNEEINILQELASNVAYGIRSKRLQVDRINYAKKLEQTLIDAVSSIAMLSEKRDPYTAGHMERVAELSAAIGRKLGLTEKVLEGLRLGALIHDIGKVYIPGEILNRPGKLTKAEFEIIKTHPQVGHDIIKGIEFPWPIADMVLSHHEKLDGSGYPNGLKGDEISLEAQILAVADVVEAVSSHRPYRPAKGIDVSLSIIQEGKGNLFNEKVVDACTELIMKEGFEFQTKF